MTTESSWVEDFFIILAIILAILFVSMYFYYNIIRPFGEKKREIELEIRRSTSQREFSYWKKELKKLYLSSIPFVGEYLSDKVR